MVVVRLGHIGNYMHHRTRFPNHLMLLLESCTLLARFNLTIRSLVLVLLGLDLALCILKCLL